MNKHIMKSTTVQSEQKQAQQRRLKEAIARQVLVNFSVMCKELGALTSARESFMC
jgi:hypothetical protein